MKNNKKIVLLAFIILIACKSNNLLSVAEESFNASVTKNSINSYSDSLIMGEIPTRNENDFSAFDVKKPVISTEETVKNDNDYKVAEQDVQLKNTSKNEIYNITLKSKNDFSDDNISNIRKNILAGNLKIAEKSMDRLASDNSSSAMDMAEIASLYENINKKHKAIFSYERSLEKQPNRIEILYNYSLCLYKAGNYNKAKYNLNKIVKINPDFMLAQYKLANIYHIKGDYLNALKYYAASAKINPLSSDTFYNIGLTLESMDYGKLASKYYTKCLKLNPFDKQAAEAILRLQNETDA